MPASWYERLVRHGGLWIVLLVLLAYWPLTTFQHSLSAGDTLDCWLPWRFFLASTMQDGAIPAWNPYQQMGYPVHADLQGPSWYPEALLLGGTIGHGAYTLSLLFLAYVIIGGLGMRKLVMQLGSPGLPAFVAGTAYALSGFFTGHAMHFYAVISAAWMPWLFLTVFRMLDAPTARNALPVSLFLFFLLTGGNHTFLIIASYPLMALGMHAMYKAWRSGTSERIPRIIGTSVLALAIAFLLGIGTFHALWEVGPYIDRAQGLGLAEAQMNPFTIRAAVSLLTPWMATTDAAMLGTDLPMANGYFGALLLCLALVGLVRPTGARERILLITAALAALASLGPALPVHELFWRWIPGMDLFRFPAYYFYFVLLAVLPTAARGFMWVTTEERGRRSMKVALAALGIVVVLLAVPWEWGGWPDDSLTLIERMNTTAAGSKMILNASLVLTVLIAAFILIARRGRPVILASVVVLELLFSVQLTQWSTTLGPVSPASIQWRVDAQPTGPVLPELRPMNESRDGSSVMHHLWRNTQIFRGEPTNDGFNSFWLKDHQALERDHRKLFEAMQHMPLVYLAQQVISDRQRIDPEKDRAVVLPTGPVPARSIHVAGAPGRITMKAFDHNAMVLDVECREASFLVVQQNRYPGWDITVDGASAPLQAVNVAAFGAVIPAGRHTVEVSYDKPELGWLRAISFGTFFVVLFVLALSAGHGRKVWTITVLVLLFAYGWAFFGHRPKADRIADKWPEVAEHLALHATIPTIVNSDRPQALGGRPWNTFRIDRPDATEVLDRSMVANDGDSLWLAWAGLPFTASMRVWAMDHFGLPERRIGDQDAGAWLFVKNSFGGPAETVLHQELLDGAIELKDPEAPYTSAFRIPVDHVRSTYGDHLVIDLRSFSSEYSNGRLVIERKRNDRTTDYEAIPFGGTDAGEGKSSLYVVRPLNTLGPSDEELVIYVWNGSSMPVFVSELRIRVMALNEWTP